MQATNIDEVIWYLHEIVGQARRESSRIGYFAALYLHVATKVKECLEEGLFHDRVFIENLNVTFFNRYFDALDQYRRGEAPAKSWLVAFEAAQSNRPTIDQHLLMGINAHINLDLGIAVARTCTSEQLEGCRADFEKMTAVLLDLFEAVMKNLVKISPLLGVLERVAGAPKDALARFGMTRARVHAWNVAVKLAPMSLAQQVAQIQRLDDWVARAGRLIWKPGPLIAPLAALFRLNERGDVRQTIDLLLHNSHDRKLPQTRIVPLAAEAPRERVAILGGGVGGLVAAFELTDPYHNPHHNRYDVTIYQIGWRLGGKGASGRSLDPDYYYRIEEHGLHAWFGFYDNAFRMIRRCYHELGRPAGVPLATWSEAFKQLSISALIDTVGGQHYVWPIETPTNDELPGGDGVLLPIRDYVKMALQLLHDIYRESAHARERATRDSPTDLPDILPPELNVLINRLTEGPEDPFLNEGAQLLYAAYRLFAWVGEETDEMIHWFGEQPLPLARWLGQTVDRVIHLLSNDVRGLADQIVLELLKIFMSWLWRDVRGRVGKDVEMYRIWIAANCIYAHVRGMIEDEVIERGFAAIDHLNYREWLEHHAFPDDGLMAGSELVSAVYDSSFAYIDGQASFEAGTALKGLIRTVFTYKGAFGWKMQAGTGDTIFAPLYEVLKRRGVKFEFFQRVKRLNLAHDERRSIASIEIARQARVKRDEQGREREYHPLFDVKGLPCWPSTPLYDQLENGDTLRQADLESPYDPTVAEEYTLVLGKHFDKVILGISIAALPDICGELIDYSCKWRDMIAHVKTVRTQALQLWLRPTASELGWPDAGQPIMSFTYSKTELPNPLNAWANMSHLIDREDWPSEYYPLSLAYFCSALADDPPALAEDRDPHQCQDDANRRVWEASVRLLNRHITLLWPKSEAADRRHFKWHCLVDARPGRHAGQERLAAQYWRANILPSDRYVLSVPGSSRYRLPAHNPEEFPNLYLAGDWTDNGLNSGCMEAATMSGMLASLALCGYPKRHMIVGVDF